MRVINAHTYQLKEFVEPPIPYAILSHTWGEEEVTLHDMTDLRTAKLKRGWQKIEKSCEIAREMELEHVWVDTCCIDKSSSAELTEAINSMYRWYRDGDCIAFLKDLSSFLEEGCDGDSKVELLKTLPGCRWFSRGWTLQELIAPGQLEFYDSSWTPRGSKHDLSDVLSQITGIPDSILKNKQDLSEISVAGRMSWASSRQTTRAEDLAYCLFGIFDVNMPLIYGEGQKAFIRLQEAIALSIEDFSLFAWSCESSNPEYQEYRGMFAKAPAEFSKCRHVTPICDPLLNGRHSFMMTNRGIQFKTSLQPRKGHGDYLMNLLCEDFSSPHHRGVIAIFLKRGPRGFARHRTDHFMWTSDESNRHQAFWSDTTNDKIEAPKDLDFNQSAALSAQMRDSFRFRFDRGNFINNLRIIVNTKYSECRDPLTRTFFTGGFEKFVGLLELNLEVIHDTLLIPRRVYLIFGLLPEWEPLSHPRRLRGWVTVFYHSCDSTYNTPGLGTYLIGNHGPEFLRLAKVWNSLKSPTLDYSKEITHIKTAILVDIAKGYSPPTTLVILQKSTLESETPKQFVIKVILENHNGELSDTRIVTIQTYLEDITHQVRKKILAVNDKRNKGKL